ncbi:MAG: DUF5683 domain-containing protein [Bacteroidales bacterium]
MLKGLKIYFKKRAIWTVIFLTIISSSFAQKKAIVTDSTRIEDKKDIIIMPKPHNPRKATLYSAVLPGLGQAYNKKYWKIPIIYAGFATFGYFIVSNNTEYQNFREAYNYLSNGKIGSPPNDLSEKYSLEQLQQGRDYYRRNFEFTIILTSLWYILNIVDASVDAHLFNYNVSNDLSLRIDPMFEQTPIIQKRPQTGLKLTLKF